MKETFRRYPIGIQNFEDLRNNDCVYIDKTALIYHLTHTNKIYFLSRPRRFGKSLLVSTLEAYFSGKKELFEGLAMEQLEKEWTVYPVLHIDFSRTKYTTIEDLQEQLNLYLSEWERTYGKNEEETSYAARLTGLLQRIYQQTGKQAVVLIDEYDAPLLDSNSDSALQGQLRTEMRKFFSPLKAQGQYLRFLFLTGISKFSQMSIFSELNNLQNISMSDDYSAICGITEQELLSQMQPDIERIAQANNETYEEACRHLKRQYDGYHFHPNGEGVFNPFSVLNAFFSKEFGNYWFQTGTPTFLVELLKESDYDLRLLMDGIETAASAFTEYRADRKNPIPLIYQSGYLTIKDYDREFRLYRLGFPNDEVRYGFLNFLLPFYTAVTDEERSFYIGKFVQELRTGNVDAFMHRFEAFFADFPYELNDQTERHYQVIIYLIFKLMGQFTQAEVHSSRGRADAVVRTPKFIYIFEFKLNGTVEQAMEQIEEKGYAFPYTAEDQQVIKVGVEFSAEKRNVERWMVAKEI